MRVDLTQDYNARTLNQLSQRFRKMMVSGEVIEVDVICPEAKYQIKGAIQRRLAIATNCRIGS